MFRPMRRSRQQLSEEECLQILNNGKDGVLAVHGDNGYPYAVPLNYIYLNGAVYIHCAKSGHKLDAIKGNCKVSFCVVSENEILKPKYNEMYRAVKAIAEKYCPDYKEGIENEIKREWDLLCMVKINPDHITGKQCKEFLK